MQTKDLKHLTKLFYLPRSVTRGYAHSWKDLVAELFDYGYDNACTIGNDEKAFTVLWQLNAMDCYYAEYEYDHQFERNFIRYSDEQYDGDLKMVVEDYILVDKNADGSINWDKVYKERIDVDTWLTCDNYNAVKLVFTLFYQLLESRELYRDEYQVDHEYEDCAYLKRTFTVDYDSLKPEHKVKVDEDLSVLETMIDEIVR